MYKYIYIYVANIYIYIYIYIYDLCMSMGDPIPHGPARARAIAGQPRHEKAPPAVRPKLGRVPLWGLVERETKPFFVFWVGGGKHRKPAHLLVACYFSFVFWGGGGGGNSILKTLTFNCPKT